MNREAENRLGAWDMGDWDSPTVVGYSTGEDKWM